MTPRRPTRSVIALCFLFVGACSSGGASPGETGGSPGDTGGGNQTGGQPGTGGGGPTGGTPATGGSAGTGGRATPATGGETVTGGSGTATGGGGVGGAPRTGGSASGGTAGREGTGGAVSTGGSAGGASGGGDAMSSAGCKKTRTLQNGTLNLTVGGASRKYTLKVPDGYDNAHPYRLVFAFAWSGASASQVVSANYFTFAKQDPKDTIFIAPEAANGAGSWSKDDVAFTDAILAQVEGDLCVDKTRVFASGFSFGGGMAMALACTRADVFRAVAFFSGADLTGSCPSMLTKPIAYYASQASEDANGMSTTSPITGEYKQAQFAALNGCTAEPASTTFPTANQPHKCTIYKNCSAGHPTEYCVFNGQHGWEPRDPGQSTSWDAPEAWKFITQF